MMLLFYWSSRTSILRCLLLTGATFWIPARLFVVELGKDLIDDPAVREAYLALHETALRRLTASQLTPRLFQNSKQFIINIVVAASCIRPASWPTEDCGLSC